MSRRLLSALSAIEHMDSGAQRRSPLGQINPRAKIVVTVVFLVAMLSMPVERLSELLLFFIYPIVVAAVGGVDYGQITIRSLLVVPFVALIALPNIFLQREVVFFVGERAVCLGWITALSIVVRGVLSVQAVVLLVATTGFYTMCRALRTMGLPAILTSQIFFTMRYLRLLIEQALAMHRARQARGFGRRHYPLPMWGIFLSQLLLRSVRRAEQIGDAMAARQFRGDMPALATYPPDRWRGRDTLYAVVWCGVLALMRTLHFAERFF